MPERILGRDIVVEPLFLDVDLSRPYVGDKSCIRPAAIVDKQIARNNMFARFSDEEREKASRGRARIENATTEELVLGILIPLSEGSGYPTPTLQIVNEIYWRLINNKLVEGENIK